MVKKRRKREEAKKYSQNERRSANIGIFKNKKSTRIVSVVRSYH